MDKEMKLMHTKEEIAARKVAYPPTRTYSIEVDGLERTFEVYVPACYDGKKKVPLLLSLHGASGHYMPEASTWHLLAERECFLIAYPEAVMPGGWSIWNMRTDVDDIHYLDCIMDFMLQNYSVDETRLYIHGHSMGDNMATTYVFKRGSRFAAAALLNGPTLASVIMDNDDSYKYQPEYPLPVVRMHGTRDLKCGFPSTFGISNDDFERYVTEEEQRKLRCTLDQMQKDLWMEVNQCEEPPQLSVDETINVEFYRGEKADFVYFSVNDWEHNPELEAYQYVWDRFLTGYRRIDGRVVREGSRTPIKTDVKALAVAEGASRVYFDNHLAEILPDGNGKAVVRDGNLYLPLTLLQQLFPGTRIEWDKDNAQVWYGRNQASLTSGYHAMIINQVIYSIPLVWMQDGIMMVPAKEILKHLYGYYASEKSNVFYFADHPVRLTYDTAYVLKVLLQVEEKLHANRRMERELLERIEGSR